MSDRVSVVVCTFRRESVRQAIRSLDAISVPDDVELKLIVVDNDDLPSARHSVQSTECRWPLEYVHAPARNISIARNAGLDAASQSEWIAFIDDDETVSKSWLENLWETISAGNVDVVLGPALADYPPHAPDWMADIDMHSNIPVLKSKPPQTGHTCNVIFRWKGTPWSGLRFDEGRGQTGGEDTAFFFEVSRAGAVFSINESAVVYEIVDDRRLTFDWLAQRKFRMGQSYSTIASSTSSKLQLAAGSAIKCVFSRGMYVLMLPNRSKRNFWRLRSIFHAGIVAGCFSVSQQKLYQSSASPLS